MHSMLLNIRAYQTIAGEEIRQWNEFKATQLPKKGIKLLLFTTL